MGYKFEDALSGLKKEEIVLSWMTFNLSEWICVPETLSREDDSFDVCCGLCIPGVMWDYLHLTPTPAQTAEA